MSSGACDACLRRTSLLAALGPWLDLEWRRRSAPTGVLSLPDEALLALDSSGRVARAHARFGAGRARERIAAAGLSAACHCDTAYPERLRELADPPAVLHVAGRLAALERTDGVGIVGARRGTPYGLEVARSLGRGLARAGVPVVSGMALGVDSAAHIGALEKAPERYGENGRDAWPTATGAGIDALPLAAGLPAAANETPGATADSRSGPATDPSPAPGEVLDGAATDLPPAPVAVLAGAADVPYPASRRRLYARLVERGCVVSEFPPGFTAFRWCFVARNRLIAGLSALTVVVEATERSGSLTTADFAEQLGRPVSAVPGPVTSRFSAGTNGLLAAGAGLVRDTRDVLDQLGRPIDASGHRDPQSGAIGPRLSGLLDAIERGHGSLAELTSDLHATHQVLQDLTDLELRGLVRRDFGGRYVRALEDPR